MDIVEFTERFLALEREHELFNINDDGVYWWDAIRQDIFHCIYYQLAEIPPEPPATHSLARRVLNYLVRSALRFVLRLKTALRTYDVIVFRCARHRGKGGRVDIAIDQLAAVLNCRKLVINTFPHYYHLGRVGSGAAIVNQSSSITAVAEILAKEFALHDAPAGFISERVHRFKVALRTYERMFRAISPKLILAVQNGSEKAMFCAARSTETPIAEAQHGLIHFAHAGYSYARGANYAHLTGFPDLFLAFSDYWLSTCYYPAQQCTAVGNDGFYVARTSSAGDDVLFVSATIYDSMLRPLIKAVALRLPNRRFKYKLHPNQRQMERDIRLDLARFDNVEVISGHVTVREVLRQSSVVVLIQSTVAHEALQAGKSLCIVPVFDYRIHADLLPLDQVTVTPSVAALVDAIGAARHVASPPEFFDKFDGACAEKVLGGMLHGRSVGGVGASTSRCAKC